MRERRASLTRAPLHLVEYSDFDADGKAVAGHGHLRGARKDEPLMTSTRPLTTGNDRVIVQPSIRSEHDRYPR